MTGSYVEDGLDIVEAIVLYDDFIPSIVALPDSKYVYSGIDRGDGVEGTLHASNISDAAGSGSDLQAGDLKAGVTVDDVTGTRTGGATAHAHAW